MADFAHIEFAGIPGLVNNILEQYTPEGAMQQYAIVGKDIDMT